MPILFLISSTAVLVWDKIRTPLLLLRGNLFSNIKSFASKAVVLPLPGTACKSIVSKFLINLLRSASKLFPTGSKILSVSIISSRLIFKRLLSAVAGGKNGQNDHHISV